jgi:Tol biopolymer transport system component
MLTGKRLFEGETVSHTIAEVLRAEIDFDKLPITTPAAIRDLLRRCLERDVKTRLRDIGEARIAIQKYLTNPAIAPEVNTQRGWPARLAMAASLAAVGLLAVFGTLAFIHFREKKTVRDVVRFQFTFPQKVTSVQNLAVSPDGKRVTFAAVGADGVPRLWMHSFDSLDDFSPLIGTEGALLNGYPFWSWDSRFVVFQTVGFGAGGKLKRIEVSGGPPQTICDTGGAMMSGFWSRKGQIVFGTANTGLLQVPATSGSPSPLTILDAARQESGHAFPVLLPDERHFLYRISSVKPEYGGIYVGSLNAASPSSRGTRLLPDEAEIAFAPSLEPGASRNDGNVLFVRASTLMVQRFDAARAELSGEPNPIAQSIASLGAFGISATGVLVYRVGRQDRELTWFDRRGDILSVAAPPAPYNFLALSPDDTRAAVQRLETFRAGDIWILDLARGGLGTPFARHPADDFAPVWSPDGKRIVWASNRDGVANLYQKWITGGREETLLQSPLGKLPFDWSSDGRYLLYGSAEKVGSDAGKNRGNTDLWVLPMTGERKPWVFANTEFNESQGQFSPDTRWVAYQSDESGRTEIHIQPFSPGSGGGANVMVSSGGGYQPRWRRRDGKELYYFTGDGKLVAVDVGGGATLKLGQPHVLFAPPIWGGGTAREVHRWDVSADGQKFLIPTMPAQAKTQFTVWMNWQAALKK